jgi:sugar phosphate isomerase/epimerase
MPEDRPGSPNFAQVIENAKMIGQIAKDLGMTLLYHNHDFEFDKIDGKYALEVLYDSVSADLLQTELDTCWVNVGGEEPAAYVRKYTGRAPVVHLKDFVGQKNENMYELIGIESEKKEVTVPFDFRPVGFGKQDMPAIVKAAEDAGASWVVVEQDKPSMELTPLECAQKSREYLKSIGL